MKAYITIVISLFISCIYSQEKEVMNFFDNMVGIENTGLYNGIVFKQKYRVTNQLHQYFITSDFKKGSLVFNNMPYYDIDLRYDLNEDILYAKLDRKGNSYIIELEKSKIKKFNLNAHSFINISDLFSNTKGLEGFYESLLDLEKIQLYKKHQKKGKKKFDKNATYYEFFPKKHTYVMIYSNEVFFVKNKEDFKNIFENYKSEINEFNKKNRAVFKSNIETYSVVLVKHLNSFIEPLKTVKK